MQRAALLYNPASGQRRHLRLAQVEAAARALHVGGVTTTLVPTEEAGSAGKQAAAAVAQGHDAIFACGGDGTIHDVLQGMVAHAPEIPLGIIPLGTGNLLAFDLRIPRDAARAARAQLEYLPRRIAAGHIEFQTREGTRDSRYFTLMAGVGPDALMLYRVHAEMKRHMGMLEYLRQALRVGLAHPYEEFLLQCNAGGENRTVAISQLSAVRVTAVGNWFCYFTMDSALERDDFHAVLVSTSSRLMTMAYFARRWGLQRWKVRGIQGVMCSELNCEPKPGQTYAHGIYAQADGEFLGTLPVTIRIVPQAFTLLMPPPR